jgi:hypothetical protein
MENGKMKWKIELFADSCARETTAFMHNLTCFCVNKMLSSIWKIKNLAIIMLFALHKFSKIYQ